MNSLEFDSPDEEERHNEEEWRKCRRKRLVESVQTFAPEYKDINKIREILWWGTLNQ